MKLVIKSLAVAVLLTSSSVFALEVSRFGAVPDDGQDDTATFLAAFKGAEVKGDRHIVIPKGRYDLRADGVPVRRGALHPIAEASLGWRAVEPIVPAWPGQKMECFLAPGDSQ